MARIIRIVSLPLAVGMLAGGLTASASAAAATGSPAQPRRHTAVVSGYVQLCGGPAPGRCWITQRYSVCARQAPCVTTDRVRVLNAAGAVVGTAMLHHARFTVTVPKPGRYTLELLADGRLKHGAVMDKIHAIARAGRTSRVVFTIGVP